MSRLVIPFIALLILHKSFFCIYNVRDIGFVDLVQSPYTLYVGVHSQTSHEWTLQLQNTARSVFMDTNVEYQVVSLEDTSSNWAKDLFAFWNLSDFPAAILVAPDKRSKVVSIPYEKSDTRMLWSALERVVTSPLRDLLNDGLIQTHSMILFIESRSPDENRIALETVSKAIETIERTMSQLPKRIEKPPSLIKMDSAMIQKESFLLWSLGMETNVPDLPIVAVLYGRGRRMGPILKGRQIQEYSILGILSVIGLSCECGLDRVWMMGPRIPLRWDKSQQRRVVQTLGFDGENPMVKQEMASILALPSDFELGKYQIDPMFSYNESAWTLEMRRQFHLSPAEVQSYLGGDLRKYPSGVFRYLVWVLAIVVPGVLGCSGWIWIKHRKGSR